MARFNYTARARSGEKVDGVVEATDRRAALALIEQEGHIPVSVTEAASASDAGSRRPVFTMRGRGERMSTRDVLLFSSELSDLLASGMTLGNALNALAKRQTGRATDRIVGAVRDDIVRGSSLSESLAHHPRTFTNLYVNVIRAGEASGAVPVVLRRLVEHYERLQDVKEKVVMALVYPVIVLVLGGATLAFSMMYVVPRFEMVFRQLGEALPLPTRILIGASRGLAHYGWAVAIGVAIFAVLANRGIRTTAGRFWWHRLQLRLPLIRGVVASAVYANFARTLETLLANGVPVLQALGIVEQTVGNVVIAREIGNARERVTDGTTISGPLAAGKVLPQLMIEMLSIGEQTGDMAGALAHIGRRYENELDRNVKIFTAALEPILIVVVAVLVGFVAISILMAVFNL
ncbi:MAG: type II secretion system F family protein, partial [Lentisphaerae bacterium]|nr:type II secretion system F family protein [Lentisphaerota bacterium]